MGSNQYRYRTFETTGSVWLVNGTVICSIKHRGSDWDQVFPLEKIYPYPTRMRRLSTCFWACVFVGAFGLAGGVWGICDNAGTNMSTVWAATIAIAGLVMLGFAFRNRTESWIWFPTEFSGHYLCFSKNGPDSASFDEFTEKLMARIKSAHNSIVVSPRSAL